MKQEKEKEKEKAKDTDGKKKRKLKFHSDIHENIGALLEVRERVLDFNRDKIDRRNTVHAFVNLRNLFSKDENGCEDEIINFGSTYNSAQMNLAPLESIVMTDQLVSVVVDRNNEAMDHLLGVEISNYANDWIFSRVEKFHQLWRTAIGEGYICGGGPAMFDYKSEGLYPRYNINMYFPEGTPLDAEGIRYAFEQRSLSLGDLEKLLVCIPEDSREVNKEAIEQLVKDLKEQVKGRARYSQISHVIGDLNHSNARGDESAEKLTMWTYWEVRTWGKECKEKEKRGLKYVSRIDFIEGKEILNQKMGDERATIISQKEVAFEDPRDWLVMLVFDEEVGGEKSCDTLRGVAEAYYRPASAIEELRNMELEGAMQAAKITLQETEGVDPDEVLNFQLGVDPLMPKGMNIVQLPNTGQHLSPVVADLMQTVAGISSSTYSNTRRGQELRQQAVDRQENTDQIRSNRATKAYIKLDSILDLIISRALALDPEPGSDDYRLIKGFQQSVDEAITWVHKLDDDQGAEGILPDGKTAQKKAEEIRKKLAERRYGKFRFLKVKAQRSATGLDRPTEIENAQFLLDLIETGRVAAQNVPFLLEQAIVYRTQNPDIAALVAGKPEPLRMEQQQQAALEWDVIGRRAIMGEPYPVGVRDIDEDHVESHIKDLVADINRNGVRPWDQENVSEFSAHVDHIGAHLARMKSRPESGDASRKFTQELQQIVSQGSAIIQELQVQKTEQENQNLSPDDKLKLAREQKIYAEMEMMGKKFGADMEQARNLAKQRILRSQQSDFRNKLLERQQLVSEFHSDREFNAKQQQQLWKQGQ